MTSPPVASTFLELEVWWASHGTQVSAEKGSCLTLFSCSAGVVPRTERRLNEDFCSPNLRHLRLKCGRSTSNWMSLSANGEGSSLGAAQTRAKKDCKSLKSDD